MLNLLATLVVSALPVSPAGFSACPAPPPPAEVGECEATPLDLWYRMSRFADVDPGTLGGAPARRPQAHRGIASQLSYDASPTPAQVSAPDVPPVALFALPGLLPLHVPTHFDADAHALPARAIAPPERPPRA
jgi:hypothetical protein